jgi:putative colanic acid biosynthesis acetyltransferase WcaF
MSDEAVTPTVLLQLSGDAQPAGEHRAVPTSEPGEARRPSRSFALSSSRVGASNRAARVIWNLTWLLLYRPSPTVLHGWRRFLLRRFGARIGALAHPYPRARIWAPWNLTMEPHSCLANDVDCYCVASVSLGHHVTVSQYSYLCTASHDYNDPAMPLVAAPIVIGAEAWVAADVFVGPGVRIGEGAVVGARSTVVADVDPWTVVAGSPPLRRGQRAKFVRG